MIWLNQLNNILVTGSAGFIGFHLCKSLIADGFNVFGIDNINDYYDVNLKHKRLNILKEYSNFTFDKIDISDHIALEKKINEIKPNIVVNLAAQAGVRYSIENPLAYSKSNLIGFVNIIDLCKAYEVENFIYASSSSVYGGNTNYPFSISDRVDNPISLYAATKRSNELIAHSYSHLFNLHTTGLRFFTAYGPWGRPDMAMYIFSECILKGLPLKVFNNGKMNRDFTYIDDIINGIRLSIDKNYQCRIFNLGNNRSEDILNIIALLEYNLGKKAILEFLPMQPGDVKQTLADIDDSIEFLNYNPEISIEKGIKSFINWFTEYNKNLK